MSTSRKKVIVRELDGKLHHGYLPASGLLTGDHLEVLLTDGRVALVHTNDVKHVAYVRDFNLDDPADPERMGPRILLSKPRGSGLWMRAEFVDGDHLDGLVHVGLPLLDGLLMDRGVFLDRPDKHANTQRVFVPRSALADLQVPGMGGTLPKPRQPLAAEIERQAGLFDADSDS